MSRIFINYRRQDTEGYVGRLYDHLAQHFDPDNIFMDVTSIEPGADFVQTLEEAVAACDVFIAMSGPHWLADPDSTFIYASNPCGLSTIVFQKTF